MSGVEELCLKRYFLEPGSNGPVGSVFVSDDDLLDIFQCSDIETAQQAFVASLPARYLIRDYLTGDCSPPTRAGKPDYVRILVFLCWMQSSRSREGGERDFRDLLEIHLGESYLGVRLLGLDPMWEHLQDYLRRTFRIELELAEFDENLRHIGRTLRMAFPTWRDRDTFRRLRKVLEPDDLLSPLSVSSKLKTSKDLIPRRATSFKHNFRLFDKVRQEGSGDYVETPFWQAWYRIVALDQRLEVLELARGEFGELELFRVSPVGGRTRIVSPNEALTSVSPALARDISSGNVLLEDLGFGRFRSTTSATSSVMLLKRSKLLECPPSAIRSAQALTQDWALVFFSGRFKVEPKAANGESIFAWRDGIKVGSAYLGRFPLSPRLIKSASDSVRVSFEGDEMKMLEVDDGFGFPPGNYTGKAVATTRNERREIMLVARANEFDRSTIRIFDASREISEDEHLQGSVPSMDFEVEGWEGQRGPACAEMVTIGEALYARSALGLSLGEVFGLVSRVIQDTELNKEAAWQVIRVFTDAGWFDAALLRAFPARRIVQRLPEAQTLGPTAMLIGGPTPLVVVERITVAAAKCGAKLKVMEGSSPWSLPRYLIETVDARQQEEVLARLDFVSSHKPWPAGNMAADRTGVHGYSAIASFDEGRGLFAQQFDVSITEGLYRMARGDEQRNPFLYRSIVRGMPSTTYVSPTIAILDHGARRRQPLFASDGKVLLALRKRTHLPSSWARWLSDRTMTNSGLIDVDGDWVQAYPIASRSEAALAKLVRMERAVAAGTPWMDRFLVAARNRDRAIFDNRLMEVRGARGALVKR